MSQGWIRVYRQVQDCWIWNGKFDTGRAWIDLLLLANHRDKKITIDHEIVTIERGQFHTSLKKLADRWKWDKRTVGKYLDMLESDGMIAQSRSEKGTTLTIVNYDIFQGECTTECTTESTTDAPHHVPHHVPKQEIKNVKNDKKVNKESFGEYHNVKLTSDEYDRLGNDYGSDKREQAIKYLDEYIEEKGYKSKSHNLAMRRWVFKALDEKKPKGNFMKTEISHNEIENLYAN